MTDSACVNKMRYSFFSFLLQALLEFDRGLMSQKGLVYFVDILPCGYLSDFSI